MIIKEIISRKIISKLQYRKQETKNGAQIQILIEKKKIFSIIFSVKRVLLV